MSINIKDRIAVITGGSGVLCKAMAKALAAKGATVVLINRTLDKGLEAAHEIETAGGKAFAIACDVLQRADLEKVRDEIKNRWGGCDILINGAGGNRPEATTSVEYFDQMPSTRGFFDLDETAVRGVFDLNLLGSVLPSQILMPLMLGRKGATVINISSMAAYSPMTKVPAYAAAKAAISNLTQWMAVHFASAGIRVNAIAPGFFSTEQNKNLLWNPDGSPTPRTQKIIDHTPMRRLGRPEDLEGIVAWLCDEDVSGFVTGVVIPVDGGFMAYSGV